MTPRAATASSTATSACRRCRAAGSARRRWRPAVSPRSNTCAPRADCTSACSPTNRSPRFPWKPAWARARASRNTGRRWSGRARCCTRLAGFPRRRADVFHPPGPQNAGEGAFPPSPAGVGRSGQWPVASGQFETTNEYRPLTTGHRPLTTMTKASEFREMVKLQHQRIYLLLFLVLLQVSQA